MIGAAFDPNLLYPTLPPSPPFSLPTGPFIILAKKTPSSRNTK
ncbi:exosporium leader peptide-containing protein [Bacillus thuringiensis]